MPWWWSGADSHWQPPRLNRPGRDRLREGLAELIDEYGGYRSFRTEIGLSKDACERFLEGDDNALSIEQTKAVARYLGEFGRDMETNKLFRRGRS
jgi:hypothetical protein